MKKALIAMPLVAAMALFGLSGCATNKPDYLPAGQARVSDLDDAGIKVEGRFGFDGSIQYDERNLRKMSSQLVYFQNITGRLLPNGLKEVSLVVVNKSEHSTANIQYSIHYYDASGAELNATAAVWSTSVLQPQETGSIKGVSLSRDAASFTIFVREITYTKK
jgi:hypothetical protein